MPEVKPIGEESKILAESEEAKKIAEAKASSLEADKSVQQAQAQELAKKLKKQPFNDNEVGFVSRFPVRAYVLSCFYWLLTLFFSYFTYRAFSAELENANRSGNGMSVIKLEILEPSISILIALFITLALLNGNRILKWVGLVVSFGALVYELLYLNQKINDVSSNILVDWPINQKIDAYIYALFAAELWVYVAATFVLAMTVAYFVSSKNKPAYH